jgi:hypothetical protein
MVVLSDLPTGCTLLPRNIIIFLTRVEADYNNFTIALRAVRGDKREPSAQGYNWTTLFLGDINNGT